MERFIYSTELVLKIQDYFNKRYSKTISIDTAREYAGVLSSVFLALAEEEPGSPRVRGRENQALSDLLVN
ncbi:MAG: hypothetical protein AMXMBFR44_4450 [Candidatus Campbellbacteria bacterium]